jgi:hypothetical protein
MSTATITESAGTRDLLEIEQIRSTISNLNAETAKLLNESAKLNRETRNAPWIMIATVIGALAGFLGVALAAGRWLFGG